MIIDNKNKKVFQLFNGKVINKDKSKVNTFEFDQIDFNLADYRTSTIIAPKIQEKNSLVLLECSNFFLKNLKIIKPDLLNVLTRLFLKLNRKYLNVFLNHFLFQLCNLKLFFNYYTKK